MEERLYLFKIQLLGIEPLIWRRFVVPASISLDRFHDVIQIVMGWTDSHLYEFTISKNRYTEYPEFEDDGLISGMYSLNDLIKKKGSRIKYLYDFGDDWEHELILEDSNYNDPELSGKLVCLEGERACPPEDVGGVHGYYEFCEVMSDSDNGNYEYFNEWSGGDYDSEYFDCYFINYELMKYLRWSRDRHTDWYDF